MSLERLAHSFFPRARHNNAVAAFDLEEFLQYTIENSIHRIDLEIARKERNEEDMPVYWRRLQWQSKDRNGMPVNGQKIAKIGDYVLGPYNDENLVLAYAYLSEIQLAQKRADPEYEGTARIVLPGFVINLLDEIGERIRHVARLMFTQEPGLTEKYPLFSHAISGIVLDCDVIDIFHARQDVHARRRIDPSITNQPYILFPEFR